MLVIGGREVDVPGQRVLSWMDPPNLRLEPTDSRPRRRATWIRTIVLHTTVGDEPQIIRPGAGPSGMAGRTAAAWASDGRGAGAHVLIDGDGTIYCLADLLRVATFHAEKLNEASIGIEVCQSPRLEIWDAQMRAVVALLDVMTREFGVQRQFQWPYRGPIDRLEAGGYDCVGIVGHRDQTGRRGHGDPGDAPYLALRAAGYEEVDYLARTDLALWRARQHALPGGLRTDGVPGPMTVAALRSLNGSGIWISRPGD